MLKKRVSGKSRKNKANSWMKKTGIGKNLLEKRKGGLKNLRSMRRPRGWDRSLPEERKRND